MKFSRGPGKFCSFEKIPGIFGSVIYGFPPPSLEYPNKSPHSKGFLAGDLQQIPFSCKETPLWKAGNGDFLEMSETPGDSGCSKRGIAIPGSLTSQKVQVHPSWWKRDPRAPYGFLGEASSEGSGCFKIFQCPRNIPKFGGLGENPGGCFSRRHDLDWECCKDIPEHSHP